MPSHRARRNSLALLVTVFLLISLFGCAKKSTPPPPAPACAAADALASAGEITEAKKLYTELLKANPAKNACASAALTKLNQTTEQWGWWRTTFTVWDKQLKAPALGALSVAGLALLLWLFGKRIPWRRTIEIGELKVGALKLDGDPGLGMRAQVQEFYQQMGRPHPLAAPDQVSGGQTAPDLPTDIAGVPKQVPQLLNLILQLLPARRYTVTATLQPDSGRGFGLTLLLTEDGGKKVLGSQTLWDSELEPAYRAAKPAPTPSAATYRRLALATATWLFWATYRREYGDLASTVAFDSVTVEKDVMLRDEYADSLRRLLGTTSWRSYLCNRLGAEALTSEDSARRLFSWALDADPRNRLATLNLASLEIDGADRAYSSKPDPHAYDRANQLLTQAQALAAAFHDQPRGRRFKGDVGAQKLGDPTHLVAQYFLGNNAINVGDFPRAKAVLAAARAALAKTEGLEEGRTEDLEGDFSLLLDIIEAHARLRDSPAAKDPAAQIESVAAKPWLSPRVHYNLACHFSWQRATWDRALEHLKLAAATPRYASYASGEPIMKPLREDVSYKSKFDAVVTPKTPAITPWGVTVTI